MSSIIVANKKVSVELASVATTSPAASKASAASPVQSSVSKKEEEEQSRLRSLVTEIFSRSPVNIFSKTYYPHSLKGKHILLEAHTITPKPHVVELDIHPDGLALQGLLAKTTGRRTVPNILVNGKSIGSGDETAILWRWRAARPDQGDGWQKGHRREGQLCVWEGAAAGARIGAFKYAWRFERQWNTFEFHDAHSGWGALYCSSFNRPASTVLSLYRASMLCFQEA